MNTEDQARVTQWRRWRPSSGMIAVCVCLGVMLAVGFVFNPTLTADFVQHDDHHYVFDAREIRRPTWSAMGDAFHRFHLPSGTSGYYQPLTALSLMADAWLTGAPRCGAFYFHLTNLVLHILNVALVFVLVKVLSRSTAWAAVCSGVFGVHPVMVESVAWVAQRMTVLGAFFALAALVCYLRYCSSRRFRWLVPVVFGYLAAILAKPTFIALPIALLILDVWPLGRLTWRPIVEKAPLFVLMGACAAVHYYLRSHAMPPRATHLGGPALLVENLVSLAGRIIWPVDLGPFYPASAGPGATAHGIIISAAVLIGPLLVAVVTFKFCRPLFVGLTGAAVLVLPGLFNAPLGDQLLSDQYLYPVFILPAMAWAAWIRPRGNLLNRAWGRCTFVALAGLALVFSARSYIQTYVWQTSRDLYLHTVRLYPDWSRGYVGLVQSFIEEGDLDSALFYARRAVDAAPDDPSAQFYFGRVLLLHSDGRSSEAIAPLRRALASDPDWIDCLHNLGVALADCGKTEEAIGYLEQARDLQPRSAAIRTALGNAYLQVGRPASARKEFQLALAERSDAATHMGLAKAWAANGVPEMAQRHLAMAVAHDHRCAALASADPVFQHLRHYPGFESLLDGGDDSAQPHAEQGEHLPPPRSSPGF